MTYSAKQYRVFNALPIVTLVTILVTSLHLKAAPYCLALRGNGEAQPAHWGALANLVEKIGLPQVQAGGSSASVSLMFLDGIAANPWVASGNSEQQKSRAAFLLKSLHGIIHYFGKSVQALLSSTTPASNLDLLQILGSLGLDKSSRYFFLIKTFEDLKSGKTLTTQEMQKFRFYSDDLKNALKAIGAFDAESDSSLFFRDGVVNFEKLGMGLGQIATYLSGKKINSETLQTFNEYVSTCEPLHNGITWAELVKRSPICQDLLNKNYQSFLNQNLALKENFALQPIGQNIVSLPTTAVLTKSAYQQARKAFQNYHSKLDRSFAENFKLSQPSHLKFGYWGQPQLLISIKNNLKKNYSDDEKSKRFLALGMTSWLEVLRLSPAEPGLASLQPFKFNKQRVISAGGWSDLHPMLVLKAAGCENIVYVTRKGGESLFGQGIAKRLLGFERSWEKLRTSDPKLLKQNRALNDMGDSADQTSEWSRLYNVANPNSSFMKSVAAADAVLCTNWDQFDVKKDLLKMIEESFHAPFNMNFPTTALKQELIGSGARLVEDFKNQKNGMPEWPGCP